MTDSQLAVLMAVKWVLKWAAWMGSNLAALTGHKWADWWAAQKAERMEIHSAESMVDQSVDARAG